MTTVIRLTPEEYEVFQEMLLNPPEPTEAMKAAVRQGIELSRQLEQDGVVHITLEHEGDKK